MDFRARLLILLIAAAVLAPASALADDPANLQSQIDQHNAQITQLQNDIAAYQKQLDTLGAQHQTLQTAINGIDVSRQQTSAQISVTQNKIAAANLKLQQLSGQITNKQYEIDLDKQTLAQSMREVQAAGRAGNERRALDDGQAFQQVVHQSAVCTGSFSWARRRSQRLGR